MDVSYCENIKPKVFWAHPTLGQKVVDKIRKIGNDHGYSLSLYKTDTNLHGIPQNRLRTFYFFWKDSNAPLLSYYSRVHKNIKEYLEEIPEWATYQDIIPGIKTLKDEPFCEFMAYKFGESWLEKIQLKNQISLLSYFVVVRILCTISIIQKMKFTKKES